MPRRMRPSLDLRHRLARRTLRSLQRKAEPSHSFSRVTSSGQADAGPRMPRRRMASHDIADSIESKTSLAEILPGDDYPSCLDDKNRQPIYYGEGYIRQDAVGMKALSFPGRIISPEDLVRHCIFRYWGRWGDLIRSR